jgi:DNA-binding HxlR family transcriptional regulator
MGIELAADRGRLMNLMHAGYIDRFRHAKQAGQLYYVLTDAGRQFLEDALGADEPPR